MKMKRDKVILNLGETPREIDGDWTGLYSHLVGDKIYYRLDTPAAICYAVKENDEYIKPSNNTVLSNSLAIQNFRAFVDTNPNVASNEKYKAIGGYHTNKEHTELKGCATSKNAAIFRAGNPCWPKKRKFIFADDFHHPRHANGLYIFKSNNGIDWTLYHEKPVLSVLTRCEESVLASDTMPSIFYDPNIGEYVAYLRCNIKLGVRHVFYTKSKDLLNWDTPKLITKSPAFDFNSENLYYMGAYPLPDTQKYISFTHHFKNEILSKDGSNRRYFDKKTKVMVSENGIHWEEKGQIFLQDAQSVKESGISGCVPSMATHLGPPHVVSFEEVGGMYAIYVMEGIRSTKTRLVRYVVSKDELLGCIGEPTNAT